jgi:hypothetical protein
MTMKNRLHHTVRQIGWLDAGWYGLALLLAALTRGRCKLYKYRIVAQAVGAGSLCRGRGEAIEVRRLTDASAFGHEFRRRPYVIAERYAQGAQCLAAYRAGQLLGFLWLTFGAYQEDEVRARFVPASAQACWDFDVQVFGEHQLGLAFPRLWDEANRMLRERGVRWSCSRISAFNAASRSAHKRIGAVALGSAVFVCWGRWQGMVSTLAPWCHLSRDAATFPQFRLDPQ